MDLVWMLCRIGLISSDLAAVRALIPAGNPSPLLAGVAPLPPSKKNSLGLWLLGVACGAGAVILFTSLKRHNSLGS